MIGQILKGYQIVEKIKDGSVGTVWKATNSKDQVFALKILAQKHSANAKKAKQFKQEALLTKKLKHGNIIKVHEYVDRKPQPFFSMDYFESENLKYAMWNLPERIFKFEFGVLRQVAEALAYLETQGIIHKDIKPDNVLVSDESEVRLIDFSLSQTKLDRFMQFGRRVEGTPLYMAPEQIQGRRCDVRSDIYSFGIMMYELLAKRPPFLGTTEKALFEKHVKETPPPIRTFVKTLSPDLASFCGSLIAKKPEDRPQNWTTILFELSRWERKDTMMRIRQVEPVKPRRRNRPGVGPS